MRQLLPLFSGSYFLKRIILLFCWAAPFFSSCGSLSLFIPLPERNIADDKLYADIMAFSDTVTVIPDLTETNNFYHLTSKNAVFGEMTQDDLIPVIRNLPEGQNTAVYYAVDKALDRIEMIHQNQPANMFSADPGTYYYTKYYIILFTDGQDNVSVQLARNEKQGSYSTPDQYAAALRQRIESLFTRKFTGFFKSFGSFARFKEYAGPARRNSFEIFTLSLGGQDQPEDAPREDPPNSSLAASLAAAYNGVLHEPIAGSDLEAVYEEFQRAFSASSFSFNVPKGFAESKYRIRMEFAAKGQAGFPHWFEADIKKSFPIFGSYILANITTSPGLTFSNDTNVTEIKQTSGEKKDSLFFQFTLNDLRVDNVPLPIVNERQLYMDGTWRRNSEYQSIRGGYKNAYVVLLMDRSVSLENGNRKQAEDMVINIINMLSEM